MNVLVLVAAAFLVDFAVASMVAVYGTGRGFPFFPVFIVAFTIGFPIPLLAVTIAPPRAH